MTFLFDGPAEAPLIKAEGEFKISPASRGGWGARDGASILVQRRTGIEARAVSWPEGDRARREAADPAGAGRPARVPGWDGASVDRGVSVADRRHLELGRDLLADEHAARLEQVSRTLDHFQSISAKIDNGNGTAGQLINDPKLYQALVDSATQLNATIADLSRLVEQWEQEGISFKLNK